MTPLASTLPANEARTNFYQILNDVTKYLKRFVITHRGAPRAVIMSIEDLESWDETLEISSNKKLIADIRQAEKDFKVGKFYTLDEVTHRLDLKAKNQTLKTRS